MQRALQGAPGRERHNHIVGDVLSYGLRVSGFDLVTAVALLPDMDARSALLRLRDLVAPAGVLIVIGSPGRICPRTSPSRSLLRSSAASGGTANRAAACRALRSFGPPERYATMHRLVAELSPGVQWRRRLLWRNPDERPGGVFRSA